MATMSADKDEVVESPDIHFEPLVKLPPMELRNLEEDELEVFKMRAKLFRFDSSADPPEWKERGTGEVKFLQHKKNSNVRLLMRRDKTHKVCANHYITKEMKLVSSAGSDRAWVWTVQADFADEEPKVEQLAIRFKNSENAQKFKEEFERCQSVAQSKEEDLAENMNKLTVEEKKDASADGDQKDMKTVTENQENKMKEEQAKTDSTDSTAQKSKDEGQVTEEAVAS